MSSFLEEPGPAPTEPDPPTTDAPAENAPTPGGDAPTPGAASPESGPEAKAAVAPAVAAPKKYRASIYTGPKGHLPPKLVKAVRDCRSDFHPAGIDAHDLARGLRGAVVTWSKIGR
jgi:hypothetical protein